MSWAESDLERDAREASEHGPSFIAAFCDACEYLEHREVAVPDKSIVNKILNQHGAPYQIIENELVETEVYVRPPEPHPSASKIADRAISDAKALVGQSRASSAIDRAHTALHAYLVDLCRESGLQTPESITTSKASALSR